MYKSKLAALVINLFVFIQLSGQGVTKVSGNVYDSQTKEPLPFVNISFEGTNVGTTTDLDGYFEIDSRFVTSNLCASFLSYKDQCQRIEVEGKTRNMVFYLEGSSIEIENVTIVAKKGRYRKKGNPAVELMRKVIDNKKDNRLEGQDFYSYDKYERIELDLNNITEEFKERKLFNKFDILWQYLDTSEVNGKVFLPIYLREVNSKVHYRKDPESKKEYRDAIKMTKFDESIDDQSLTDALDFLYQDINIYDNTIRLLDNNFVSPISPLALNFYRFYILDTTYVNGINSIRLGFIPRNKSNFGFTGDLYVANDSSAHYVVSADFGIIGDINLNFVRDLKVRQDFEPYQDAYIITRDDVTIDYSVSKNGIGFYGTRTLAYKNFDFTEADDPSVYDNIENVIIQEGAYKTNQEFWDQKRLVPLTENQEDLYEMIDTLIEMPAYKRLVTGVKILTTGYLPFKKFEVGPLPTFFSFNQVEGARFRLGAETNFGFSKNILLDGYLAYGTRDEKFKYKAGMTYTFNEDWKLNPRHYLRAIYQKEATFPGQQLQFIQTDNFLLSARRGATNRMVFENELRLEYTRETPGFAMDFWFSDKNSFPYGDLELPFINENGVQELITDIETTSIGVGLELSPNKQFIQGRQYRTPIINEFPIWTLRYEKSFDGLFGSTYDYHRLELGFFKRFNMSILGHSNVGLEAGKIWGTLPYTALFIPRANQSFAYQRASFNMMNFLEFVSDDFVFLRIEHFFKGFFFNRIPLLKKLGLREIATFKAVYGRLSDSNNPALDNGLPAFTIEDGAALTYLFEDGIPYMEGSVGVTNIFKVLRIDLVKRLNYLDNPNIPSLFNTKGLGIRARFKVEF